ncbi:ribose-phosphate pyrophosphokinase [Parapedobacter sp. ISTM3]|uniref:ribose-phosphate pyrophosphokinase n=1 Tax=Parapedobacter sp. ISTM3 TaxID=2800130 RepID=UPI0019046100|nr:ribose-phosphate pyrophosphokinase [Parapedobacter sp. ISTM3]MBK1439868.1 ribose-phosphate pyrophosphokinase [Parapedobacter sp. ISTM3]
MKKQEIIIFALPGNEPLADAMALRYHARRGELLIRNFPDGETYIRILSDVRDKKVVLVCSLDRPDAKLLPLYFLSRTARELGASSTSLVAPYLAYMRQDKRFREGEGITSEYFASLISGFAETITTVDPHLHRYGSLSEIYTISANVVSAAGHISTWIKSHVDNPILVGPDSESEQWVSEVANNAEAPFTILEKTRHGDRDVEVSLPRMEPFTDRTPVLVDDIISTARTMIETVGHLKNAGLRAPVCIGVHAIFAGNAYSDLLDAGAGRVITCNTIPHVSNTIDISGLFRKVFKE